MGRRSNTSRNGDRRPRAKPRGCRVLGGEVLAGVRLAGGGVGRSHIDADGWAREIKEGAEDVVSAPSWSAGDRTRTSDQGLMSPLLYQLSYAGTNHSR